MTQKGEAKDSKRDGAGLGVGNETLRLEFRQEKRILLLQLGFIIHG